MAKVLKTDGSLAISYAEKDFGSDQAEVWVTTVTRIDAASLANWISNSFTAYLIDLLAADDSELTEIALVYPFGPAWETLNNGPAGTPFADSYFTLESHRVAGGADELYVDGALVVSGTYGAVTESRFLRVGQDGPGAFGVPSLTYTRSVKAGTSRGGSDLFSDDFASGDLSAWSSTVGDVSVISDPFPPPANPATIVRRRVALSRQNQGLTVRVQQQGPSAATEIYALETIVRSLDPGGGPG